MALCQHLQFQVLTKRPGRMLEYLKTIPLGGHDGASDCRQYRVVMAMQEIKRRLEIGNATPAITVIGMMRWPLSNVWLGISSEDQKTWDERTAILEKVPAAIRFVSLEPQLAYVDVGSTLQRGNIHWLVQGGESGNGARLFDIYWAEDAKDKSNAAKVRYFLKQLGAKPMYRSHGDNDPRHLFNGLQPLYCNGFPLTDRKGGTMEEWPASLRVREFPGRIAPVSSEPTIPLTDTKEEYTA